MMIDNSLTALSLNQTPKLDDTKNDKALKEQTDNFESVILKQILDESTQKSDFFFGSGVGSDIYKSMYNDTLSKEVSGDFGYSKLLFDFLTQNSNKGIS
ncbi:MAG: rod-binding protein [Campylobacterales bacterium]|nr:rod-binding protein [Campylobacterales bacterium]